MSEIIIIIFALILAVLIFGLKGLIMAWLITSGAELFGHDLSEYFNFLWLAFAIFFMFVDTETSHIKRG